jgi:citrate lyase beta subunit
VTNRIELRDARSVLFAPGHEVRKALASNADLVVLDLEDGVLPTDKDVARGVVEAALGDRPSRAVTVRVNPGSEADLYMVGAGRPDAIVGPKSMPAVIQHAVWLAGASQEQAGEENGVRGRERGSDRSCGEHYRPHRDEQPLAVTVEEVADGQHRQERQQSDRRDYEPGLRRAEIEGVPQEAGEDADPERDEAGACLGERGEAEHQPRVAGGVPAGQGLFDAHVATRPRDDRTGGGRAPILSSTMLEAVRSLLFVPGSDERKLRKALTADADAVVADLEDGVAPGEKAGARELAPRLLAEVPSAALKLLRVNAAGSPYFEDDLAALAGAPLDALVLPKASPAGLEALVELLEPPLPVIAIVETAEGIRDVHELATHPRVAALELGALDLGVELGLDRRDDGQELLFARSALVVASAAARIRRPVDAIHVELRDLAGLEQECRYARSLGFGGKACVHPDQVPTVNRVFSPSGAEVEHARRVVDAYEQAVRDGRGAIALEGEMIDLPVVERARRMLALAERSTE